MFENFTEEARGVMGLAKQEAKKLNHEYIGTEHFLLGIVREGLGKGAKILLKQGYSLKKIREQVENLVRRGPEPVTMDRLPQTPRAKQVIEYAIKYSKKRKDKYIGTEHILYGLMKVEEGPAAQILINLGMTKDKLESELSSLSSSQEKLKKKILDQMLYTLTDIKADPRKERPITAVFTNTPAYEKVIEPLIDKGYITTYSIREKNKKGLKLTERGKKLYDSVLDNLESLLGEALE